MTSYKKLKEENKRLKEDIAKIINNDIATITRYKFKKSLEDLSMFGSKTHENDFSGIGILPVIAKPYRLDFITRKPIK